MSVFDEIKARIDIIELVSPQVKLRKSGSGYSGYCPFHDNKRTPAFAVWPETGTWRCFGACADGGDIFKYVMWRDKCEFSEALRTLADMAGVELRTQTPADSAREEAQNRHYALLEQAVLYFQHLLRSAAPAQIVRQQLTKRGVNQQSIETFELGYALDDWQALNTYLREKGYSEDDLLAVGLISKNEQGNLYDRFRNRLMIPIRDERGHPVGFGARVINPKEEPKYLNSPQTDLFNKSQLLYGLDKARKTIRETGVAVIVEGYMDVIAVHQAGYTNAVASMGTALTEQQFKLLKRSASKIIFALDGDPAGIKATLRGLETARETFDGELGIKFDARGLIHTERHLELDIRIAVMPPGQDPDDVIQQSPAAWTQLLENALPIPLFILNTLAAERNLNDPKEVGEIANVVMPIIQQVPNAAERATYRQRVARTLGIDETDLRQWAAPRTRGKRPVAPPPASKPTPPKQPMANRVLSRSAASASEQHCLGVLTRFPDLLPQVDRALREAELAQLDIEDFSTTELQQIYKALRQSLTQDQEPATEFIRQHIHASLHPVLEQIQQLAIDFTVEPRRVTHFKLEILKLRREAIQKWMGYLRRELSAEHAGLDDDFRELLERDLFTNTRALNKLNQAMRPKKNGSH